VARLRRARVSFSSWRESALHRTLVDGQVDDGGDHRQADGDDPDNAVGARVIEDVAAEPAAEESADLVKQEDEAREHGEMLDAEHAGDHAVGERHRGKPGESKNGGEQVGAQRRQRESEQQGDRFRLAIYKPASLKNVEVSVRLKAAGSTSDRDGGVAVRLRTPDNYYLVQLDALRDRVLLSLVTDGVSEEIAGVDADIASHTWHTLAVRAVDAEFVVRSMGFGCSQGSIKLYPATDASRFGPRATA